MSDIREITNEPWVIGDDETETPRGISIGGRVIRYVAAGSLNIGDAVVLSAAGVVNKSAVSADGLKRVGIVVGGEQIGLARVVVQRKNDIGKLAATVNQAVLVAHVGVCWAVAQAAIAAGAYVKPDVTTPGRVLTAAVTTDVAAGDTGKIIGIAIDAAAIAGDLIRVQLTFN